MRSSYYFKNFILVAGVVMLAFIILGAIFVGIGRNYMLQERRDEIESNAIELSRLASAYSRDGSLEDMDFRVMLSSIARSTGNHCFVTNLDGVITTCSDTELVCSHIGREVGAAVMDEMRGKGYYSGMASLDGLYDGDSRYVAALPVMLADGTAAAYIFAASSVSGVMETWASLLRIFLITALSIMLLLLVLCYISTRVRARPLAEMAEAAVQFAHGDFSARVHVDDRDDDLGALAASFNQMAEAMERSEKRRSDFIANVAHELKTPMTTISGFADGILDGTIPTEQERNYLETISSETKRLNRLVRSMLDVSRMQGATAEELRQKSFDAAELLIRTLVVFESKINAKGLDVDAMVPEDPILVCGDADSINQVIYNLLENAVKFATPGSELGVSLFKQGEKAYISIKNRGATIPEEELSLIFDRFHKTDRSRSEDRDGYGLGLYIVKTILGNHGEDIAVTSRDGVTEFCFSLTLKR